jgi:predicted ATP-grasp superfamily ATP-dependent carboligase
MKTPSTGKQAENGAPDARGRGALILGGAHGSLAVARSLGRRGIPVWFVTHDHPIAKYSRYTAQSFDWPGPDEKGAAAWLVEFAARHRLDRWVLYPGGDTEARLIAQCHPELAEAFTLVTPPWSVARFACDKRLTHLHADSVGVDTPWTVFPSDRREVAALDCDFPVVLKPAYPAGRSRFAMAKAWRADDRATLLARYDKAASMVGRDAIMVQEWIPGGGETQFSYAAVWDRGKPVASLVAQRRREYPVDIGHTSTYVETTEHREVEAQAFRFLADLRFSGMAEVKFKFDARDGRAKLLDVNPRPWTWIGLGATAGVDFAWIQWRLATGESLPRTHGRAGHAWAHVSRDLFPAIRSMRDGELSPLGYVHSLLRTRCFAAYAADDPWPAAADLPIAAGRAVMRSMHLPRRQQRRARFSRNRPAPSH